jgi:GNAT superfamily N-acetyltransferase
MSDTITIQPGQPEEHGYFRKLSSADQHLFRDHLLRLDQDARRARFAMLASDAFLRCYAETSFSLGTVIHGYFAGGTLRAVAELRPLGDGTSAEAAFSVEPMLQRSGIGTRLMELTLITARNRGCRNILMNCLATNRAMQKLARRFTDDLTFEMGDVVCQISSSRASAFSLVREQVSDLYGLLVSLAEGMKPAGRA